MKIDGMTLCEREPRENVRSLADPRSRWLIGVTSRGAPIWSF
jgi:hypothetical protein